MIGTVDAIFAMLFAAYVVRLASRPFDAIPGPWDRALQFALCCAAMSLAVKVMNR